MTTKKTDYKSLNEELDELLTTLQAGDVDVDEALKLYERGLVITKELETLLKKAENKVTTLKTSFSD